MALTRLLLAAALAASVGPALAQPPPSTKESPGTLNLQSRNPDAGASANNHFALGVSVTTDSSTTNVGYSDENAAEIGLYATNGQALLGGGTTAKRTFLPLDLSLTAPASGQRIGFGDTVVCFGMSDCAAESESVTYGNGPVAGDEGEGLTVVNYVRQQGHLVKTTITAAPAPSHCNTTVAQDVAASKDPQAVAVADASQCAVGDWVVLNTEAATPVPNQAAMQVTAVAPGRLTGVFEINMAKGETITPATVLRLGARTGLGQDRVLVDEARSAYAAGKVTAIAGYAFAGQGAAWSDAMVGGSALDPGCIMLSADAYTGAPFGPGPQALNSWYEIKRVTGPSGLEIFSTSVAGDASYRGRGPGDGAYQIAPCARMLRVDGDLVVLNTNSFAWAPGDAVEEPITPYADSTGYQLQMGAYTNGVTLRAGYAVTNVGARTIGQGLLLQSNMPATGGADTYAWRAGIGIQNAQAGVVQFGGESAYSADGVTRNGFAAFTPGGAPSEGTGLFLAGFDYGAQLAGRTGAALQLTNTETNHGVRIAWPQLTADRAVGFPDQSGTLALSLAATTPRLGGAPLAAGACATADVAVTGATTQMTAVVSAGGGVDPGPGFMPKAWVSGPDKVTVAVCAMAAGAPAPTVYNVRVIQ
jgi:hypothetical protein